YAAPGDERDDGRDEDRDRRREQSSAQFAQVLPERHAPLAVLAAPPAAGGGHTRYGFGSAGDCGSVAGAGAGADAAASGAVPVAGASASSLFMVFTSLRKMRIDWPMLRASPGSLGAPNRISTTA